MYSVIEAGIVAGHTVEVGDMIMAMVERNGTDNLNSDWTVLQANIDTSASEALAIAYAIAL